MSRSERMPPSSAGLFEDARATPPSGVYTANIDGASRGNPGPASYAVIVRAADGSKTAEIAKRIGFGTNNVAEYYALIAALDYAVANSVPGLRVRSDSELLVRQMQGRYKVKSAELQPLHERAQKLARALPYFVLEYVPRERNREADALANQALDSGNIAESSGRRIGSSAQLHASDPGLMRVRAEYKNGALVPSEELRIPEGSQVELQIRIVRNR